MFIAKSKAQGAMAVGSSAVLGHNIIFPEFITLPSVVPHFNPHEGYPRTGANMKKNPVIRTDDGERICDKYQPNKPTLI